METSRLLKYIPSQFFLKNLFFFFPLIFLILFLSHADIKAMASTPQVGATLQSTSSKAVPSLDGKINASEWSDAFKVSKTLELYNVQGQITESHLLTLYVKNDQNNLYIAGQLDKEEHDGSMKGNDINSLVMDTFSLIFDNNNDGILQSGEDKKSVWILNKTSYVKDEHRLSPAEQQQGKEESSEPQNIKGKMIHTPSPSPNVANKGHYQFEISIPLNSGDASDIQLQPGQKVRWNLFYFDKFSVSTKGMGFAGWFGYDMESSKDWGYLQLADAQEKTPATAAPMVAKSTSNAGAGRDIQVWCRMNNERDLEPEKVRFIGSHFDLVLSTFPFKEQNKALRKQNPDIKVLLFTNPYFPLGDEFWDKPPSAVKAAEKKYSLKTKDDKMILYGGPVYGGMDFEQRVPLMDVSNRQWQDYFAAQARKWVDYGEMDGVYLDTLTEEIPSWALAPGKKYPKNFSVEKWKASNYEFLSKVEKAFSGTDSKIYWNGITRAPPEYGDYKEIPNKNMLNYVDGTFIEAYSVYLAMDENESTKRWYFETTIMKDMKSVSEQGKVVIIEAYGNRDDDQTRLYALTSFLLVQNDRTFFYFTKMNEAGDNRWRPEWDVKLGKPLGSYQKLANGAYSRDFESGKVLVNPGNKAMTVQFPGKYKSWKGDRVESSLNLQAFSGALLTKE